MEPKVQNKIQAIWRIGDGDDIVELEFVYDLANVMRSTGKQCVKVTLTKTKGQKYKLTAEEPSFKISIPLTKNHFGAEGVVTADFSEKIVYFNGRISVDTLKCPPPPPEYKMVLFNFY